MSNVCQGFHINEERHYLIYDAQKIVSLRDKIYFNKNTIAINVVIGVEGNEFVEPISDKQYILIEVVYRIANYFGDKSGRHIRTKDYFLDGEKYWKDGTEVVRLPKEVKMALTEFNERR